MVAQLVAGLLVDELLDEDPDDDEPLLVEDPDDDEPLLDEGDESDPVEAEPDDTDEAGTDEEAPARLSVR